MVTDFVEGLVCEECGDELFGKRAGYGKKIRLCDSCHYKRVQAQMVKDKQEARDSLWGY